LKIAILSCFYPFRGGIAQYNANIFEELSKSNVVRAFNFKRQYPDFLFPGKTQYVTKEDEALQIESTSTLDSVNPLSYISTAKTIRKWDPDILIIRYWMSYFAPSLGFVARHMKKRCKVIAIMDNVIPHEKRFFDTPFTKYFTSGCDGYVVMCSEVAEDLKSLKPGAKYITLFHPLYSHFGDKLPRSAAEKILGLKSGKKNILFFGLIREYKGLDILLRAFEGLDDEFQLIIAGEPYGSFEKYQKIIDGFTGKDRIKVFPKYIRDSEVKEYFSAADVTVLPYRSATQSGISAISYHFEVPMIVTNVGGLKETIGDTGTGIVAEKTTPEAIRKEILNYFGDPLIRDMCSENIRKEKIRLSWSSFCKSLLDFADKLA
jgi:glycosyltransferase involved in cell wall biosynthesis